MVPNAPETADPGHRRPWRGRSPSDPRLIKPEAAPKPASPLGRRIPLDPGAVELVSQATLAMEAPMLREDLARNFSAHPTFLEALRQAGMPACGWRIQGKGAPSAAARVGGRRSGARPGLHSSSIGGTAARP